MEYGMGWLADLESRAVFGRADWGAHDILRSDLHDTKSGVSDLRARLGGCDEEREGGGRVVTLKSGSHMRLSSTERPDTTGSPAETAPCRVSTHETQDTRAKSMKMRGQENVSL
jgi:hypothetical protein